MARHDRGNNLFSVDTVAIRPVLAEANAPLVAEIERHLHRGRALFHAAVTEEQLPAIRSFLAETQRLQKRAAAARLADGRPFAAATREVANWFGTYEDRLKRAHVVFHERTRAFLRRHPAPAQVPPAATLPAAAGQDAGAIRTVWEVQSYDPATIDFNELAPFFTDASIRAALRSHLAAGGARRLRGVTYARSLGVT